MSFPAVRRHLPNVDPPSNALTWQTSRGRTAAMVQWRSAVLATFGHQSRCVCLAWVLSGLFNGQRGYAYASDAHLAQETKLPVNKMQEAMTRLDQGGAIVRVHHPLGKGKTQRLIYPASTLIVSAAYPRNGGEALPPEVGGT